MKRISLLGSLMGPSMRQPVNGGFPVRRTNIIISSRMNTMNRGKLVNKEKENMCNNDVLSVRTGTVASACSRAYCHVKRAVVRVLSPVPSCLCQRALGL